MFMRSDKIFLGISVILIIVAGLFSYVFFRVPQQQKDPSKFTQSYSLVLKDYDGKDVHIYEFRRKVMIAYAWASWCPYCKAELENLAKEKQKYGNDILIVAVNRGESLRDAKAYTDALQGGSQLTFLLDPGDSFFKSIGGYAMPETVFIDEKGDIVYHQRGPLQLPQLEDELKELLK